MSKPSVTQPGLYESVDGIYLVRPTRDGQRLYAEELIIDTSGITVEYASQELSTTSILKTGYLAHVPLNSCACVAAASSVAAV